MYRTVLVLTEVTLKAGRLADLVDPDQWGVANVLQHVGHDACLMLPRIEFSVSDPHSKYAEPDPDPGF
jgi:hypothetical protein